MLALAQDVRSNFFRGVNPPREEARESGFVVGWKSPYNVRVAAGSSRVRQRIDSINKPDFGKVLTVLSVRPRGKELVFQLYGRSLHPELFESYASRTLERGGYRCTLDITSAGHVISWRYGGITLTEVSASAQQPLPQKRRLISYRLRGRRNDALKTRGGVNYQMEFEVEAAAPEVFYTYQQDLAQLSQRQGLLYHFAPSGRMSLGAVSYMHVETRARKLLVQAFHTFPDDYAIVKSQTVFMLP